MLLWAGTSWGSAINVGKNDMSLVPDLPFARALVERSVELDDTIDYGAGWNFLAVVHAESLGGDLEKSRELFERALEQTERRSLLVQLSYAQSYSVKVGDRDLFVQLLSEVLEAGDVLPARRMSNVLAKRRAARLLRRVDEFF